MNRFIFLITAAISISSCAGKTEKFDASGTFEADEVIVSSELPGKLVRFSVEEGAQLAKDSVVGAVDAINLGLQQEQVQASIGTLGEKTVTAAPQVELLQSQLAVQQSQLTTLQREKGRIENLLKADAATGKQLDDINAQIDVARKQLNVTAQQINVQRNNAATQNRSVLSETKPLQKRIAQLKDQEKKAFIINPISGTVISKYAQPGEITAAGKALYKIADLSTMTLRAYITGTQLPQVKLNDVVTVLIDEGKKDYKTYSGTISWVSDKAEFTPKTIQTKEERANLVYAIKVKVKNDGYLKMGMYADVKLAAPAKTN
jgi:HlyD family secretion protein